MFRAPQWHGATQTHFPLRPRKSAWHCDITSVIRHTVCPQTTEAIISHDTASHPAHQRKSAWHCDITDVVSPPGLPTKQSYRTIPPIIPLTSDTPRLHQHVSRSPVARRHANALSTKAAQIRMALQHHEHNFATRSARALLKRDQSKISPAFRALDTRDLRRGLRGINPERGNHLHFAPSTRTIAAEACARPIQNAISPAFRALNMRARSPQRVARDRAKTQSHLHFAPSTRTISAESCARPGKNAISPGFNSWLF